jgi:hypothetical protein
MIKCGDVDGKGMRCIYAYPDRPKCSCWLDWPDIATIDANHDCHCPDLRSARLKENLAVSGARSSGGRRCLHR